MIRKFKNNNLLIGYDSKKEMEEGDIDSLYNGDMFWNDLYIDYFEDEFFLFDTNKGIAYSLWLVTYHFGLGNILSRLHSAIVHGNNRLKFYYCKGDSESLFERWSNRKE